MRRSARLQAAVLFAVAATAYLALACLLTWPLTRHLQTYLLGDPSGDTGVYVWNLWIFRHELLRHGHLPFSTNHVFGYTGGADFAVHNYAPVAGMLGAPLVGDLGIVGAFNVVLIVVMALSGLGMFVLARRLGLGRAAAWSAGALFVASPVLTAKQTAHFSLVNAAPLPLFLWALLRTLDTARTRDAILVGALVAVAAYSDAYYGIYCAIMGAFLVACRFTRVEWRGPATASVGLVRALDVAIVLIGALIAWAALSDESRIAIGRIHIGLKTFYTPILVLVIFIALRAWLRWRPIVLLHDPAGRLTAFVRLGLVAVAVCLLLLLPVLVGVAVRFATNHLPAIDVYWRSSPRGLDALAYFVPNPNHPWFGDRTRRWFMPDRPDAFPEFVGSFSIVAFALIAVGAWRGLLPRLWLVFTGFFIWLSLGPFIHIGGVNTQVIGPWAFLRYAPVFGLARSPSRFAIVAVLGLSLLSAFAFEEFRRRARAGWVRWAITGALALALGIELLPAPRPLHSAAVPDVYHLIAIEATGDESGRLLELPTGIRDGASSLGNFNAATQYFQTRHRRPLIGGYLSRVSRWRKMENSRVPMLRVLFALSEGRTVSSKWMDEARASRDAFLRRSCVRFVVVSKRRASNELRAFAVEALTLKLVHQDAEYELYTPANPPACEPSRRAHRRLRDVIRQQTPSS